MSDPGNESVERLREQVIDQLSNGYSQDFLSEREFEERVEQATGAQTHQELRSLILDLPVASSPNPPATMDRTADHPAMIEDSRAEHETLILAVFSGSERKGVWEAPRTIHAVSMFGGTDLDFREARIPRGGVRIHAFAVFGGIDITVPEDVNVVVNGAGVFGGFGGRTHRVDGGPGAPTITVDGLAMFGGVDVKVKSRDSVKRRRGRRHKWLE